MKTGFRHQQQKQTPTQLPLPSHQPQNIEDSTVFHLPSSSHHQVWMGCQQFNRSTLGLGAASWKGEVGGGVFVVHKYPTGRVVGPLLNGLCMAGNYLLAKWVFCWVFFFRSNFFRRFCWVFPFWDRRGRKKSLVFQQGVYVFSVYQVLGGGFKHSATRSLAPAWSAFFIFTLTLEGNYPMWLIFFKWVAQPPTSFGFPKKEWDNSSASKNRQKPSYCPRLFRS